MPTGLGANPPTSPHQQKGGPPLERSIDEAVPALAAERRPLRQPAGSAGPGATGGNNEAAGETAMRSLASRLMTQAGAQVVAAQAEVEGERQQGEGSDAENDDEEDVEEI